MDGIYRIRHIIKNNDFNKFIKIIHSKNFDIDGKDSSGNSPLMIASKFGRYDMVKYLLDKGANIDTKNYDDETALTMTFNISNLQNDRILPIVKLLIKRGANINCQRNYDGFTPLILASQYGLVKIVKLLLNMGADINHRDAKGNSTLMIVIGDNMPDDIYYCNPTCYEYIERSKEYIQRSKNTIANVLLDNNANINLQNELGETALMVVLRLGKLNIAKLLLSNNNIIINNQTKIGDTALIYALKFKYTEIVKLILDKIDNI